MRWEVASGFLDLEHPLYIGILNITPDSFSDGGRHLEPGAALAHAEALTAQGAGVLDLGAESTRPGAMPIQPSEEWERLQPVMDLLRQRQPHCPLSLDTRHVGVALKGLGRGASILNDITGFSDPELLDLARESRCGLIAMRSRTKDGALLMPEYSEEGDGSIDRAVGELREIKDRLLGAGIAPGRILLDPGFGFGTTYREDLALWEALPQLPELLDWPARRFCLGVSRKRFAAWHSGDPDLPANQRDDASRSLHEEAKTWGYRVFRTHALPAPRIRPANLDDVASLAEVHVASWQAAYQGTLPESFLQSLTVQEKEAYFRNFLETAPSEAHRLWLIESGERIVGFAATGPGRDPDLDSGQVGEIYGIYLAPQAWNRGLGRMLMAHALGEMHQAGFREAVLWVLERNGRARRFYEAGGWSMDGHAKTEQETGIAFRELRYRRPIPEQSATTRCN